MREILFEGKPITSYFRCNSLSELVNVITFMEGEIEYYKLNMVNMQERIELKQMKYWLNVLNKRFKDVEKRRQTASKIANLRKKKETENSTAQVLKVALKFMQAKQREKPEGSGKQAQIKQTIATKPFPLLNYNDIVTDANIHEFVANAEHKYAHDGLTSPYNVMIAQINKSKQKNIPFNKVNMKELSSEFMMPKNPDVIDVPNDPNAKFEDDWVLRNPDGSPMSLEQMFESSHRVMQWVNTEEEQVIEDKQKEFALMSLEEQQRIHEQYLEEQKEAQEARRIELEDWEKTQRIKRMADKLINAAKAKEEIKCLIPKKLDVAGVEESLANTDT